MSGANSGAGALAVEVLRDQREVATKLAAAGSTVKITELPDVDPRSGYYKSTSDGVGVVTHELVLCPAHPRRHLAGDLKAIVDLAADEVKAGKANPAPTPSLGEGVPSQADGQQGLPAIAIWVSPTEVKLVLDHSDRREHSAVLPLAKGEAFGVLAAIKDGRKVAGIDQPHVQEPVYWRTPKTMIDLLRIGLGAKSGGVVEFAPFDALTGIRNIKVTGTTKAEDVNTAGRASQSAEVVKEATGWKDEWEDVTVTLPVYEDLRLVGGAGSTKLAVGCDFSMDLGTNMLRLRPKAGELARAVEAALLEVISDLRAEVENRGLAGQVAVYRGADDRGDE